MCGIATGGWIASCSSTSYNLGLAIKSFSDRGTKDVYDGRNTGAARRTCPQDLWAIARRKLDMLHAATADVDLRNPPSNHFEKLKGNLAGFCSIRINDQYRIVFRWEPPNVAEVSIDDYH